MRVFETEKVHVPISSLLSFPEASSDTVVDTIMPAEAAVNGS